MKISKSRLENFYAKEYSLEIVDLMDHENKAVGTSVQLEIPCYTKKAPENQML